MCHIKRVHGHNHKENDKIIKRERERERERDSFMRTRWLATHLVFRSILMAPAASFFGSTALRLFTFSLVPGALMLSAAAFAFDLTKGIHNTHNRSTGNFFEKLVTRQRGQTRRRKQTIGV